MAVLKAILTVVFLIVCVALVVIVLLQEGKSAGLTSSISGGTSGTFWEKNKGRSMEGKLEKITKYAAILFLVLALVLNIL